MKALNLPLWAILPTLLFVQSNPALPQTACGAPKVKLGNNFIQVAPTGSDDTENIQCALDLAIEGNIPKVRLTRGEFFISTLSAQNFVGTLQGSGRDLTRVNVLDQSVDCAAVEARGETTAAIKFAGGEPRVRWLTLVVDGSVMPCATGGGNYGGLDAMLHFSDQMGRPAACRAGAIYGTLDLVNLEGPRSYAIGPQAIYTGVLVAAEESGDPDCRNTLLGSIRINRSLIQGFSVGAWLKLRGYAQVSVLNTDFDGNHAGLRLDDSNALVTVFGSRFASKAPGPNSCCEGGGTGISVHNEVISWGATRLDIYGNRFDIRSGGFDSPSGIHLIRSPGATSVRPVISGNHFQLTGDLALAVSSSGVSGGILNDNLLTCYLQLGGLFLELNADVMGEANQWALMSNKGLADVDWPLPEGANIYLGRNSSNALIGPGQAAVVRDEGMDNIVLPQ